MPKQPHRLTLAGLMFLVVLAALLIEWFRPMTEREAIRAAHQLFPHRGTKAPMGDSSLPWSWLAREVTRAQNGDYVVYLVPEGPEEAKFLAKVYVNVRTRRPWAVNHGPVVISPQPNLLRLKAIGGDHGSEKARRLGRRDSPG